jgi:hypothetical protein
MEPQVLFPRQTSPTCSQLVVAGPYQESQKFSPLLGEILGYEHTYSVPGLEVTPPAAIMSPSKIQRRMLLVESGHFKWHLFTKSNRMWVHPLLNERGELLPNATDISSHSLSITLRL